MRILFNAVGNTVGYNKRAKATNPNIARQAMGYSFTFSDLGMKFKSRQRTTGRVLEILERGIDRENTKEFLELLSKLEKNKREKYTEDYKNIISKILEIFEKQIIPTFSKEEAERMLNTCDKILEYYRKKNTGKENNFKEFASIGWKILMYKEKLLDHPKTVRAHIGAGGSFAEEKKN